MSKQIDQLLAKNLTLDDLDKLLYAKLSEPKYDRLLATPDEHTNQTAMFLILIKALKMEAQKSALTIDRSDHE